MQPENDRSKRRPAPHKHLADVIVQTLSHAAVGCTVSVGDGPFSAANRRFLDLVAYEEEELLEVSELDLTHGEDRSAEEALLEDLLEERRDTYMIEKRYLRRNRSTVWVRVSVTRTDDGRVVRFVEDISDAVTAAGDAARFQQELVEARRVLGARVRQNEALARLGTDVLTGVHLNVVFEKTCRTLAEVLGLSNTKVLQLTPEKDAVILRAGVGWQPGLAGSARVSIGPDSQAGYTLMSGHPVVVRDLRQETRFSGPPLLHEHGIVSGMSIIIQGPEGPWGVLGVHDRQEHVFTPDDVTFLQSVGHILSLAIQRHHSEERVRDTQAGLENMVSQRTRQLQEAYDGIEAFSYTVAHDLRSPLASLRQLARITAEDVDGDAKDSLMVMEEEAAKMERLVNDLLDFAQAERAEPKRESLDLGALARDVAKGKRREWKRGVEFRSPQQPLLVKADPNLVRVVLENLLSNAWKFTVEKDEPVVELGFLEGRPPIFFVRDNGAGFDPAESEEAFVPFRRLHGHRYAGTGVGLATVQRIIERHGGRVWAESTPGSGSTFYFTLAPGDARSS